MKIAIIGHFGGKEKFTDGQTVKTVTLYDSFVRNGINGGRIDKVDTYYIKKNPFRFLGQLLRCVFLDKKIIVLLSSKGRKALFPVLFILGRWLNKEVYHYAIGGRLAREAEQNKRCKRYVSSFAGNWMESATLADSLHALGVQNAVYLPNFKTLTRLTEDDLPDKIEKPCQFCTFSRVMEEKGISDAIQAIREINTGAGRCIAVLDIYGPVAAEYQAAFESALNASGGSCRYCGIVEPNQSVEVLKRYYALLFPTHWRHEGIPGTIVDALSAGVPIIARRWQYCDEMITDGKTGYVYDFEKPEELTLMLQRAMEHEQEMLAMKRNCLKKAEQYSEKEVLRQICEQMKL